MADYVSQFTGAEIDSRLRKAGTAVQPADLESKQDTLVSGENIKTVNGQSIVGSGNIQIQAGDTDAVKYVEQTLTDAQKEQARTNIAAASAAELGQIVTDLTGIEADIDSLEAAVQAIGVGDFVTATALPTASASTMGHIYLIGPDANNNYDRYFTQESGGAYSWVPLGSTQIGLSTYATQEEVSQLEAILDINSQTETVTKTLVAGTDYTIDTGYCPATYGDINTNANFKHSSLLSVRAGDVIDVKASGPNSIAIIAKKTNATRYDGLVVGSGWNNVTDYTYTANEDLEIIVSWQVNNSMPDAIIKITRTETITTSAIDDLQDDMAALQASQTSLENAVGEVADDVLPVVTDDLTTDLVTGKYITHAGSVVSNASFSYKVFAVRAGAVIVLDATIHQNVAAISKKIINAHPDLAEYCFEELVPATSTTPATFTYTATENMTIAVSFNNTATRSITITTNEVGANTANIGDIIGNEETYAKALMVTDINYGYMFDKIAVIGDSLASGRVEGIVGQPDAAGRDFYNFSWLSFLSKRWRCSAFKNYSNAGADTASWLTDWLPVMQADSVVYDAYFIALGTNNEYNESDPSGDQTNYDAFIERYNDILDAVRAKAPNAVIFILSLYEPRAGAGNTTLEEIAETRMLTDDGVFYIDFVNETSYFRYSSQVNWRGHFSSTGYVYVASAIARMVDKIIWNNKTEEFWVQFAKYHNGD